MITPGRLPAPQPVSPRWERLRAKLAVHARALAEQGSLSSRVAAGRRVWSVRYLDREGDRVRHRAIYVGGPDLRDLANAWLDELRAPRRWSAEVAGLAAVARRVPRLSALRGTARLTLE